MGNTAKTTSRIKSKKELIAFFNSHGIAKELRFLASLMLPKNIKFKIKLDVGDSSFVNSTDNDIHVGVPETVVGLTKEEVLCTTKGYLIHEVGHLLYTDNDAWDKFRDEFGKYFAGKYNLSDNLCKKLGHHFINGAEDGREEAVMKIQNPGTAKYLEYTRYLWYKDCETEKFEQNMEPVAKELSDTLFATCSLATMGILPKNYEQVYQSRPDLLNMLAQIKPLLTKFVSFTNPKVNIGLSSAIPTLWEVVHILEPWLADILKRLPEPKALKAIDGVPQMGSNPGDGQIVYGCFGEEGEGEGGENQTGAGQSNKDDDGKEDGLTKQAGGPHSARGNDEEDEGEYGNKKLKGGKINREKDEDETTYDTDMNKMVEDAMKQKAEQTIADEHNVVQQASFEDMKEASRQAEENEEIDPSIRKEVNDYYANLSTEKRGTCHDWASSLKIINNTFPKLPAPEDIKLDAKMLNKEFIKIFLNKAERDIKNKKRGILDTNSLYKIKNRDFEIFKKKGNPRDTDYVFYILVDFSGSMGGNKYIEALKACAILEEALKGIAKVKIVAFNFGGYYGSNNEVNHYIIKGFKETETGNSSWTFANHRHPGGCNMDGFSIRIATRELLNRPERRKILFTLSDGQPNGPDGYNGDRAENDVREAVAEARKAGLAVFNLYFSDSKYERESTIESFLYMYNNKGIVACDPEYIAKELLRVVKRELSI